MSNEPYWCAVEQKHVISEPKLEVHFVSFVFFVPSW
jgi:hypothetical protein